MGSEERPGPGQEASAGHPALVGQDLGVGQPGVIIHGDVDVVVADAPPADLLAAAVEPPAATVGDAAQLLDIDVDQLAGLVALVAQGGGPAGAQPGAVTGSRSRRSGT